MLQESMSPGDRLCGVESVRGRGAKLQSHAACQNGVCVCEKWQWGLCLIDFLSEHFSFLYSAVTTGIELNSFATLCPLCGTGSD